MKQKSFHLALPCLNIFETEAFYVDDLGAEIGRKTDKWIDINLFGNQITFTEAGNFDFNYKSYRLGTEILPSFHFGIISDAVTWNSLYQKLMSSNHDVTNEMTFLENKAGEHLSFFIKDPNGYLVEFKSFKNSNEIFVS